MDSALLKVSQATPMCRRSGRTLAINRETQSWCFLKGWPLSTDSESLGLLVTSTDFWAPSRFIPSKSPGVGHRNCSEEETDAPSDVYAKWGLRAAARAVVFKDGPRQAARHLAPIRNARQQPREASRTRDCRVGQSSLRPVRLRVALVPPACKPLLRIKGFQVKS